METQLSMFVRTRGGGFVPLTQGHIQTDDDTYRESIPAQVRFLSWLGFRCIDSGLEPKAGFRPIGISEQTWKEFQVTKTETKTETETETKYSWHIRVGYYMKNQELMQALHREVQRRLVRKGWRWEVSEEISHIGFTCYKLQGK